MPSKLYTVYSTSSKKHLGYSSQHSSCIFAFIREDHAIQVKKYLKYDAHKIDCINKDSYIIRNKSVKQLKKPIDKHQVLLQRFEPETLSVYLFINGVNLKVIDKVNIIMPAADLALECNYKIELDVELDQSVTVEVLNNLYKNL